MPFAVLRRPAIHAQLSRPAAGPIISAASQGVGLLQILLLTRGTQAGVATDAYFFLFGLALLPAQILVDGLLYPALLNRWTNAAPVDRLVRFVAPVLAALAVVCGAIWLAANHRLPASLIALSVLLAINGALTLRIWRHAVQKSATGSPLWLAGMMLPANLAACVALLPPWSDATVRATAMVVGLVAGNALNLTATYWADRTDEATASASADIDPSADHDTEIVDPTVAGDHALPSESRAGGYWFLGRSISGYTVNTVIQATAALLPASSITIMSVLYRVVASGSHTFVNAVIPRYVHAETTDLGPGLRFARGTLAITTGALVVALLALAIARHGDAADYARYAVLATLWLVASATSAAVQRMAFLLLPPIGMSQFQIGCCTVIVVVVGIVAGVGSLTISILVVASVANDMVPALYALVKIGQRRLGAALLGSALAGIGVLALLS